MIWRRWKHLWVSVNYMRKCIFITFASLVLPIKRGLYSQPTLFNTFQQYCSVQIMNQGWPKPVHRGTWNVFQTVIIFIDSRLANLSLVMLLNYIRKWKVYLWLQTLNMKYTYIILLLTVTQNKCKVGLAVIKTSVDLIPS